jgi:hypothetical protein
VAAVLHANDAPTSGDVYDDDDDHDDGGGGGGGSDRSADPTGKQRRKKEEREKEMARGGRAGRACNVRIMRSRVVTYADNGCGEGGK